MLTMQQSADYLGVHYVTFAGRYKQWGIPCHRYSPRGMLHFRLSDLEEFLNRTRETA